MRVAECVGAGIDAEMHPWKLDRGMDIGESDPERKF